VTAIHRQIQTWRESGLLGQLIRFGISGGISTLIYSAIYLPLTAWVFRGAHAVYAVPIAFAFAVTAGFFLHSRWSFKGHGNRYPGGVQQAKFVGVQASGMILNAAITWVGTAVLGYAPWVPLLPAIAVATIFTFILNRWLVFA
jgi:putative flippase GtrA